MEFTAIFLLGVACFAAGTAVTSGAAADPTASGVQAALDQYDACVDGCEPAHSRCHSACAAGDLRCTTGCLVGMFDCAYRCGRLVPPYPEVDTWWSRLPPERRANVTRDLNAAQAEFIGVKSVLQDNAFKSVPKISELTGCYSAESSRLEGRFAACAENVVCKFETVQSTLTSFCKCGGAWAQRTATPTTPAQLDCYTATKA